MGDVVQPFRRHPRLMLLALLIFVAQTILALAHGQGWEGWGEEMAESGDVCPADKQGACPAPTSPGHDADCSLCASIHAAYTLIPSAGPAELIFFSFERAQPTIHALAVRPT